MFKKPLIIASTAALIATATISTQAKAGDPLFGALVGGALLQERERMPEACREFVAAVRTKKA